MISVDQMREALHKRIDAADEATLVNMFRSEASSNSNETLAALEMEEILRRRERHLRGEGKSYTWEEIKDNLRSRFHDV